MSESSSSGPATLADIPYEVLTGSLLTLLDIADVLHLGTTSHFFRTVALDEHFWRQRTLHTFRLPPQPIRQKGWSELYRRLSTAKVFTWGFNEFGRLGHSYNRAERLPLNYRSPTEIESLRNEVVVDLGCGGWSTWALTSTGKVYGWGKVEGDQFRGDVFGEPHLIPFQEPVERIAVGRRTCLALAESGSLLAVDKDFDRPVTVKLSSPDVLPELPSKDHPVEHLAVGWHYAAAVFKGIGIMVWEIRVPLAAIHAIDLSTNQQPTIKIRDCKARKIVRPEVDDENPFTQTEIVGLMVGDGYLIYLTRAGTVHRYDISDRLWENDTIPSSFQLTHFTTTPQLSYLSGSFHHFGLFNTAGDVLIGNHQTQASSLPYISPGLQHRGIIGLSWGDWHALALCEDGTILSWGKELRLNGCLGMGYKDIEDARTMGLTVERSEVMSVEPRRIERFCGGKEDKFAFCVSAAGWHSAALVADFKVQKPRARRW